MRVTPSILSIALLHIALIAPADAQTTTTNCSALGNTLNCTSNTQPSLQQQVDRQNQQTQQNLQQFSQNMANLGAAIAQRRAAQAAQQAIWDAAATEQAKQGAAIAKANYEATSAALIRFASDSSRSTVPAVNTDLVLDWSLLDGAESFQAWKSPTDKNVRWEGLSRWALTDTPSGGTVLRNDYAVKAFFKNQYVADYFSSTRFDPASGSFILTNESRPKFATIAPEYTAELLIGTHAFSTGNSNGYEVTVPPGTYNAHMVPIVIAAMPGELPPEFRIWVVDGRGEVIPADIQVSGKTTVNVLVGQADRGCEDQKVHKERREAVILKIAIGTTFSTDTVLATAPHRFFSGQTKCTILRK